MRTKTLALTSILALTAMAAAFVFGPQQMTVKRGRVVEGTLGSLQSSDNNRLVVENGIRISGYDNPIDIEGEVVCGAPDPQTMTLAIESAATTVGLVEYVEMWEWNSNRFVEVYRGPIRRTDTRTVVDIPLCWRFTGSGGQMKIRYWVDARGPVTLPKWRVALDELTWDVNWQ